MACHLLTPCRCRVLQPGPPELPCALVSTGVLLKVITGSQSAIRWRGAPSAGRRRVGGADLMMWPATPACWFSWQPRFPGLPILALSGDLNLFPAAVAAGATIVGDRQLRLLFTPWAALRRRRGALLTRRTRRLLPSVVLSVTVPHKILPWINRSSWRCDLAAGGADLIQTEGGTAPVRSRRHLGLIGRRLRPWAAAPCDQPGLLHH